MFALNSRGSTKDSLFLTLLLDLGIYIIKYEIQGKNPSLPCTLHGLLQVIQFLLFLKYRLRACLEFKILMKYLD